MSGRFCVAVSVLGCLLTPVATGEVREQVDFQIDQTTTPGQSVYVLGSLQDLGAGDVRKAVKLEPSAYPSWRVTIALPVNTDYSYQYFIRDDSAAQAANAGNGTPIDSLINASTSVVTLPGKRLYHHTSFTIPVLNWRQDEGAFNQTPMVVCGEGRTPGELKWVAESFGAQGKSVEFFISDDDGTGREPGSGNFNTSLDGIFVQALQLFDYEPPAAPDPVTRDYDPGSPPFIDSSILGEMRRYRVALPRAYAQNPEKRYPVLYMHDGQNVFDMGAFGTWNALPILNALQQTGRMQEIIVVAVDNTPSRSANYTPPQVGGRADDYVDFLITELEPMIDAQYRTLTGADTTGAMGSSSGANVSMYMGWDHTQHYARVGALSGVWEFVGYADTVVKPQPKRDIRIWIDSGDSGNLNDDGFDSTYDLRDNLITKSPAYVLGDDLAHAVGLNAQHNESAWADRLPEIFPFLYPADEYDHLLSIGAACGCGIADITTQGAGIGDRRFGVPDGFVTGADISFYVNLWVAQDLASDVTTQGAGVGDPGFGLPDGLVTGVDISFFVNRWVEGCVSP